MLDSRADPTDAALRWVLDVAGGEEVLDVRRLTGGITSAMHALDVRSGGARRKLVLREIDQEPWLTHAVELLEREAGVMRLLRDTPVPAPELVAVAPPRLLMTRLPGALRMETDDLGALARTLVTIHSVVPARRPRIYQSWAEGKVAPAWGDAAVWERAIAAIERPAPQYRGCFLHRDYHLGNVLFEGGEVSGVVDWVETSWGPPDLDVAHCCTNLAMTHGVDAPARFRAAYADAGGTLSDDPYWALLDAVGFLPDPRKATDREPGLAWDRLEAYAGVLVSAPSSLRAWPSCS